MTATKDELDRKVEGQTIASRWLDTVDAHPDNVALRAKDRDSDGWVEWTYAEVADRVARAAAGLGALGVGPGDRVVLMMRNIPEFHVVDLAAMFCGATPISIYNSSPPEQVAYLAGHSGATLAVVEDLGFAERFAVVRDELPKLQHVVVLGGGDTGAPGEGGGLIPGGTVLEGHDPIDLRVALGGIRPDSLATVIYTSGTTGPPKGVMISHYNVVWTAEAYLDLLGIDPVGFRAISYLPMAHIAERMSGHYLAGIAGFEVTTCPDPALIGSYLREVHPQTLFGVPRVWEKLHAGVQAALSANADAKARFDQAVAAAEPIAERRTLGNATAEDEQTWASLDELAFRNVRQLVGLDAVQLAITGAAPIPPELIRWYRAIGVPMSEIYGLSETTGPMTWDPYEVRVGTVGRAFPGVEVFLGPDGEVCCRGGNVFVGYLDDPDKTAAALEPDGTFHSGDIGQIDDDGYLRIVDRKKELIITAGGKNVSPGNLEAVLKTVVPIGQACAVGDNRPFVAALVVLDPEVAPGWFRERGIEADSLAGLAADPRAHDELQRAVDEVMTRFSTAERVRKIAVLADEWMPDSEELTPTSKLKRRGILAKYADQIEALYA
ncbi:MAG TPA: AMP-dependent synthetase/ligase [Acidimicrobiales bacterium]|nr:AMP-dependent synthetase/ligase [Acidimicrobiales bacterium]